MFSKFRLSGAYGINSIILAKMSTFKCQLHNQFHMFDVLQRGQVLMKICVLDCTLENTLADTVSCNACNNHMWGWVRVNILYLGLFMITKHYAWRTHLFSLFRRRNDVVEKLNTYLTLCCENKTKEKKKTIALLNIYVIRLNPRTFLSIWGVSLTIR